MEHIHGLAIPRTLSEAGASDALALIVYDMQVGIVSQLHDGADVVARVAAVLDLARRAGLRIFFTRLEALAFAGGSLQTDIASLRAVLTEHS